MNRAQPKVPMALPGAPTEIRDPLKTLADKAEFDKTARGLVAMFQKFAKFESRMDADVRAGCEARGGAILVKGGALG